MAASPAVTEKPITKKNGRPSIRSDALAQEIFERVAQGESLNKICQSGLISYPAVCRWLTDDETFRKNYGLSRELQAEKYADEIVDIADDSRNDTQRDEDGNEITNFDIVQRARLRVDARKWVAAKLLPKKYGEKANETHVTSVTNNNLILLDEGRLKELQERRQAQLLETVKEA